MCVFVPVTAVVSSYTLGFKKIPWVLPKDHSGRCVGIMFPTHTLMRRTRMALLCVCVFLYLLCFAVLLSTTLWSGKRSSLSFLSDHTATRVSPDSQTTERICVARCGGCGDGGGDGSSGVCN